MIGEEAYLTVLGYRRRLSVGRDSFEILGLAVVQLQTKRGICVNKIHKSTCKIKQTKSSQFPRLVSRSGFTKTNVVK